MVRRKALRVSTCVYRWDRYRRWIMELLTELQVVTRCERHSERQQADLPRCLRTHGSCRIVLISIKAAARRAAARPAARPPAGHAAWGPVPTGGGTQGRAPHPAPAIPAPPAVSGPHRRHPGTPRPPCDVRHLTRPRVCRHNPTRETRNRPRTQGPHRNL